MPSGGSLRRWPAIVAVCAAVAGFFAVELVRNAASNGAVSVTTASAPVPAAQYDEQAPHVDSRLWLYPPQGKAGKTPALPPEHPTVSAHSFARPIAEYIAYSQTQLRALAAPLAVLRRRLADGDRNGAEHAWDEAWAGYLHLGAVYLEGPVSDLNDAIDGSPGGLPGGTESSQFTGFHRIEFGLWTGLPTQSMVPVVDALRRDIGVLEDTLPKASITPLDYATRAHEILEDSARDLLSGTQVPWSQQGVLGTAAGVAATREVLATLQPLLTTSVPAIELDQLQRVLTRLAAAHGGSLPSNRQLTQGEKEQLDAALGQALEALAQIPGLLETTAVPQIPEIPRSAVRFDP